MADTWKEDAHALPQLVRLTAGGLLYRRKNEIEVCLLSTPDRRKSVIPRARVHEDERLSDAAVRCVRELTGYSGRAGRLLARGLTAEGEIACLYLIQCSEGAPFEGAARFIAANWVPLSRAFDLLATPGEKTVVRRAAEALGIPLDPPLPFPLPDIPTQTAAAR